MESDYIEYYEENRIYETYIEGIITNNFYEKNSDIRIILESFYNTGIGKFYIKYSFLDQLYIL